MKNFLLCLDVVFLFGNIFIFGTADHIVIIEVGIILIFWLLITRLYVFSFQT